MAIVKYLLALPACNPGVVDMHGRSPAAAARDGGLLDVAAAIDAEVCVRCGWHFAPARTRV
jgi:hypothetical protein